MTGDRRLGGHWLVTLAGRVTGVGTPLADRVTKVERHQLCQWGGVGRTPILVTLADRVTKVGRTPTFTEEER